MPYDNHILFRKTTEDLNYLYKKETTTVSYDELMKNFLENDRIITFFELNMVSISGTIHSYLEV